MYATSFRRPWHSWQAGSSLTIATEIWTVEVAKLRSSSFQKLLVIRTGRSSSYPCPNFSAGWPFYPSAKAGYMPRKKKSKAAEGDETGSVAGCLNFFATFGFRGVVAGKKSTICA